MTSAPMALAARLRDNYAKDSAAFVFLSGSAAPSSCSRSELWARVDEIAEGLKQSAAAGGIAAILTPRQEDQTLHYLAALSVGLVPCILTPPTPKLDRRWFLVNTAKVMSSIRPAVVITDLRDELSEAMSMHDADSHTPVVSLYTATTEGPAAIDLAVVDSDIALLQFSSGTTGIKKGVKVTVDAMTRQLDTYGTSLAITDSDCIVNWLPLYHDMGFFTSLHLSLYYGVTAVMLDPIEWVSRPRSYLDAVTQYRGTLSWHPNFAYQFMAVRVRDIDGLDLSSLRILANCSEPATYASQEAFCKAFAPAGLNSTALTGCYAMAETVFAVTHGNDSLRLAVDEQGPTGQSTTRLPAVSVGTPLPGVAVSVRGDDGNEVDEGLIGEIWIRADFLASGYVDGDATAAAFVDGWYRTGDLGYRKGESLYISGRKKDMIIVAGSNFFPEDIEAIVGAVAGFKMGRVAAFALFDERRQTEQVVVVAEPDGSTTPDAIAAMKALNEQLQLSSVSIQVKESGWLIKSSSGKIARGPSSDKFKGERQ